MIGYKIIPKKSMALIYTNDKQTEREIQELTTFHIAMNNTKYIDVTLTKKVKDLYDKNFNPLKNEIEDDIRKGRDLSCSWISRINIVKMAILPKAIYRFHAILMQISTQFFTDLKGAILNFIWKKQKPRIAKIIFNSKSIPGGITIPILRLYSNSN